MFLFIQSIKTWQALDSLGTIQAFAKKNKSLTIVKNKSALLISDLPKCTVATEVRLRISGHPSYPSQDSIHNTLNDSEWKSFGARFNFNTQNGQWSIENDPVGAFSPYMLIVKQGILLSDRLNQLSNLKLTTFRENSNWLADMLISGFPHDNMCMLNPFTRIPASSIIKGANGSITEILHNSFISTLPGALTANEAVAKSRKALQNVITMLPEKGVGIHLTGGYDSRLILATLLRLGIRPKTFIFGIQKNYNSELAAQLSKSLNLEHHFICLDQKFEKNFEKDVLSSCDISSPSHTHVLFAADRIANEADYLLAGVGGGEVHRGFIKENVAFPWILANIINKNNPGKSINRLILKLFPDLKDLLQKRINILTAKWKNECMEGNAGDILLRNVFGEYFRSIMFLENIKLPTIYPYLEQCALKTLLCSPFGFVYGKNLQSNAFSKLKSQQNLVSEYLPCPENLIKLGTDKGFPPDYLLNPIKWPLIPLRVYKSRTKRMQLSELNNEKWLRSLVNHWHHEIIKLMPELNSSYWKKMTKREWSYFDMLMQSRILHIVKARKTLNYNV